MKIGDFLLQILTFDELDTNVGTQHFIKFTFEINSTILF